MSQKPSFTCDDAARIRAANYLLRNIGPCGFLLIFAGTAVGFLRFGEALVAMAPLVSVMLMLPLVMHCVASGLASCGIKWAFDLLGKWFPVSGIGDAAALGMMLPLVAAIGKGVLFSGQISAPEATLIFFVFMVAVIGTCASVVLTCLTLSGNFIPRTSG